jgi:hypothetical protein
MYQSEFKEKFDPRSINSNSIQKLPAGIDEKNTDLKQGFAQGIHAKAVSVNAHIGNRKIPTQYMASPRIPENHTPERLNDLVSRSISNQDSFSKLGLNMPKKSLQLGSSQFNARFQTSIPEKKSTFSSRA